MIRKHKKKGSKILEQRFFREQQVLQFYCTTLYNKGMPTNVCQKFEKNRTSQINQFFVKAGKKQWIFYFAIL